MDTEGGIMSSYIEVIKIALLTFPFLAFFISFPFILINYHTKLDLAIQKAQFQMTQYIKF